MVRSQMMRRGVSDDRVLSVMSKVERHLFVPPERQKQAYRDSPLPIGERQTISQPYVVAFMTEQLRLQGDERVLEVGTGSGYQTAILAKLAQAVYSVEIVESLYQRASALLLNEMGLDNVHLRLGDAFDGWAEEAPFDAILSAAAAPCLPKALLEQLAPGGRLILPLGREEQSLMLVTKKRDTLEEKRLLPVRFVPMTGRIQKEGRT